MSQIKKRKTLTLQEKYNIIRKIESGMQQTVLCKELNLSKTTVSGIWTSRQKILQESYGKSLSIKKIRNPIRTDVDKLLLEWFKTQRSLNMPISGPILQQKAEHFGRLVNGPDFKCTSGWIERFKKRYNITKGKIHGEAMDVNVDTVQHWIKNVWPEIRKGYNDSDIFNADETGLFYKLTPDRTLRFKQEKCIGGKQSKVRVTVLVCANMNGTEKCKLLVIGKFMKPRCLKNVKRLPVSYNANSRAWMTAAIFENEIRRWDDQLRKRKRKILLLVDNCPAHPQINNLTNIRLEFLPPNCTASLQPMDQGIIHCLKARYRRYIILEIIKNLDKGKTVEISLLDAIRMLAQSWQDVSVNTIKNCFKHAGWVSTNSEFDEADDLPLSQWIRQIDENNDDDWDIPLSEWLKKHDLLLHEDISNLNDYTNVDSELITTNVPTDDNVINEKNTEMDESDSEDDDFIEDVNCDKFDPLQLSNTLLTYLEKDDSVSDEILNAMLKVDKHLRTKCLNKSKQCKITDFFK